MTSVQLSRIWTGFCTWENRGFVWMVLETCLLRIIRVYPTPKQMKRNLDTVFRSPSTTQQLQSVIRIFPRFNNNKTIFQFDRLFTEIIKLLISKFIFSKTWRKTRSSRRFPLRGNESTRKFVATRYVHSSQRGASNSRPRVLANLTLWVSGPSCATMEAAAWTQSGNEKPGSRTNVSRRWPTTTATHPVYEQCQQHRHRLAHRRPSLHPLCTSRYFPRLGEGRKGGGIPQQGSWNSDLAGRNPLSLPQWDTTGQRCNRERERERKRESERDREKNVRERRGGSAMWWLINVQGESGEEREREREREIGKIVDGSNYFSRWFSTTRTNFYDTICIRQHRSTSYGFLATALN